MWSLPLRIKVYEALGALGDRRLSRKGNIGTVRSSEGDKTYDVAYDPDTRAITSNDNGSYWQKYLGYPAISLLLDLGVLTHDAQWEQALAGLPWKKLNDQFKHDYGKTEAAALSEAEARGHDPKALVDAVDDLLEQISTLKLEPLGTTKRPPKQA